MGDNVVREIRNGVVPVFGACGFTSQMALQRVNPKLVITHSPGYMLITNIQNRDLAIS